jgi:hypothetical protein
VGTNRRYSHHYDRLMDDRIVHGLASQHPLQSLTSEERRADALPVTRDPQPKPCRAWVRFGPHSVQVTGVVVVWNDIACGIEFTVGDMSHRCWVWANAVDALG